MPDTTLSPTGLVQVEVGASEDTWGDKLNANSGILNGFFGTGPALKLVNGGTGATTASAARTNLGLGTMATQNATAVAITGGTMVGVAVTGGSVSGITDLAVADGGTGASSAAAARSNLGVAASGANGDITSLSALSTPLSIAQGGTGRNDGLVLGLSTSRTIAMSGDVSWSVSFGGTVNVSNSGTLATLHGGGTFGSATAIPVITFDGKGRCTTATTVPLNLGLTSLGSFSTTSGTTAAAAIPAVCKRLTVVVRNISMTQAGSLVFDYSMDNGASYTEISGTGSTVAGGQLNSVFEVLNPDVAIGSFAAVRHNWDNVTDVTAGARGQTISLASRITHFRIRAFAGSFTGGNVIFIGE